MQWGSNDTVIQTKVKVVTVLTDKPEASLLAEELTEIYSTFTLLLLLGFVA